MIKYIHDLVSFVLMYTFYHIFFIIFYNAYLKILKKHENYFENCVKSKQEEKKGGSTYYGASN